MRGQPRQDLVENQMPERIGRGAGVRPDPACLLGQFNVEGRKSIESKKQPSVHRRHDKKIVLVGPEHPTLVRAEESFVRQPEGPRRQETHGVRNNLVSVSQRGPMLCFPFGFQQSRSRANMLRP